MTAQGEAGATIDVDVPVIQGALGGTVKTDSGGTLGMAVKFAGDVPVAFALQTVQLVFDDNSQLLTTQQLVPGDAAARSFAARARANADRGPIFLQPQGAFLRVAE